MAKATRLDSNQTEGEYVNSIVDATGHEVRFGGGGKGQKAFATVDGFEVPLMGEGTSKLLALRDLWLKVQAAIKPVKKDKITKLGVSKPDEDRVKVDEAIALLSAVFSEVDVIEEDDDRTPGPVWADGVLVSIVPCVGECMAGQSDICDCRCEGANHGLAMADVLALFTAGSFDEAISRAQPVKYGPKPCLCGCGGETLRRFVPGHDARYHARVAREARAAEQGITLEALADLDKEARLQKARDRRAAKRAARVQPDGESAKTDA